MTDVEDKIKETKNWLDLSVAFIEIDLVILGFILTFSSPTPIIIYLLLIAFPMFVTNVSANSTLMYEYQHEQDLKKIKRWAVFSEYTFGIGYTLMLCAFAIYVYVVIDIIAPFILIVSAWILLYFYTGLKAMTFGKKEKFAMFRSFKKVIWLILEGLVLVMLFLDYTAILNWIPN